MGEAGATLTVVVVLKITLAIPVSAMVCTTPEPLSELSITVSVPDTIPFALLAGLNATLIEQPWPAESAVVEVQLPVPPFCKINPADAATPLMFSVLFPAFKTEKTVAAPVVPGVCVPKFNGIGVDAATFKTRFPAVSAKTMSPALVNMRLLTGEGKTALVAAPPSPA